MTLPTLSAQQPIVNPDRRPSSLFLRFMDEARRAQLATDAGQDAILAELAAQLALIIAAQATADTAQATADAALASGSGSKAGEINGSPGGASASIPITVVAGSYIEVIGGLSGGTLDADASWFGTATLTESNGITTNTLGVVAIEVASSGLVLPGPAWQAEDSTQIVFNVWGVLGGSVTYALTVARTSGANFVAGATIGSLIKVTPPA